MHFGELRENSVKIGNYIKKIKKNIKKIFWCLRENVGCIPLAVVMMTIAHGMLPTFFR